MREGVLRSSAISACALLASVACNEPAEIPERDMGVAPWASSQSAALAPLPRDVSGLDRRRAAIGRRLFKDKRLSGDGLVACHDCHRLDLGGANGESKSSLPRREPVPVNVPTVFNVAFDFRYAWNGRFETLEAQIDFAETAPNVMRNTWSAAARALSGDSELVAAFAEAYPGGLAPLNVRDTLVQYVRSLITPDAPFDRYLRGELELSADARQGYALFRDYGCVSCHQGVNVGGNMYQRFGVMIDYFAERGRIEPADLGRYTVTKRERDRHVFRVPSLRNVELTAPYFHDGSAATLDEAIVGMARYQLRRELKAPETAYIAAFLRSLTGTFEGRPL